MSTSVAVDSTSTTRHPGVGEARAAALFHNVGYMRSWGGVAPDTLTELTAVIEAAFRDEVPPVRIAADGRVVRLDAVFQRHPAFERALLDPAVLGPLQLVLGPDIEVVLNRHNHATLNRAGDIPVRLHRDILNWSRPLLTVILYLEDAPAGRGATLVVPCSHRLPSTVRPPDGGGGVWADDHDEFTHVEPFAVPVPMLAGEALVFDSLLFHSVGLNESTLSRTSLSFAVRAVDELDARPTEHGQVLVGERRYLGNDADHGQLIPALNRNQVGRRYVS